MLQPWIETMDLSVLESLLDEDESATLDFKREQYRFIGASDDDKSELLKDLLAFANAWRRTDAYIIIGAEKTIGSAAVVKGSTDHPDDASFQQFVNTKTSRPLEFSYEVCQCRGASLGIFRIPVQQRPIFATKNYGKVRQNLVYVRRGSSTDVANPEEIARMGAAVRETEVAPRLEFAFVDADSRKSLGANLTVTSALYNRLSDESLPRVARPLGAVNMLNQNYFVELRDYIWQTGILRPLFLSVTNRSRVSADDLTIEFEIPHSDFVFLIGQADYPARPNYYSIVSLGDRLHALGKRGPDVVVTSLPDVWRVSATLERVRPQATGVTTSPLYVGCKRPSTLEFDAVIYGHNLPQPTRVPVALRLEVRQADMTLDMLRPYLREDAR